MAVIVVADDDIDDVVADDTSDVDDTFGSVSDEVASTCCYKQHMTTSSATFIDTVR